MNSDVSICNMALTRLGQQRISSLTQAGLEAELSNQWYEVTRQELLNTYDWSFAVSRKRLTVSADENLSNLAYMYTLPIDYMRILTLLDDEDYSEIEDAWQIEGDKLLSDKNPAYAKYIKDHTIAAKFPQAFVEALYLRIATKMCIKMTQDQSLLGMLYQEYSAAMQSAMGIIGANSHEKAVTSAKWTA